MSEGPVEKFACAVPCITELMQYLLGDRKGPRGDVEL